MFPAGGNEMLSGLPTIKRAILNNNKATPTLSC